MSTQVLFSFKKKKQANYQNKIVVLKKKQQDDMLVYMWHVTSCDSKWIPGEVTVAPVQ